MAPYQSSRGRTTCVESLEAFLRFDLVLESIMRICDINGYRTAIAVSSDLIMPSEWLARISGRTAPHLRLFFVFADRHHHQWRKRLDPEEFNLGSGDRALVEGGRIHPRYRIMVPEEFVKPEASDGA